MVSRILQYPIGFTSLPHIHSMHSLYMERDKSLSISFYTLAHVKTWRSFIPFLVTGTRRWDSFFLCECSLFKEISRVMEGTFPRRLLVLCYFFEIVRKLTGKMLNLMKDFMSVAPPTFREISFEFNVIPFPNYIQSCYVASTLCESIIDLFRLQNTCSCWLLFLSR